MSININFFIETVLIDHYFNVTFTQDNKTFKIRQLKGTKTNKLFIDEQIAIFYLIKSVA